MYEAKIMADSLNPRGDRLTTFQVTYPRYVHSELLTHRLLSRNSASSRAIPNDKLIKRIMQDPVIPVWWGINQSGMQATQELSEQDKIEAVNMWLEWRDMNVAFAEKFGKRFNIHKQIINRPLEAWMFITVIVTATEWENFFHLRTSQIRPEFLEQSSILIARGFDPEFPAQPEIQKIARMMWVSYQESLPEIKEEGHWHLPYVRLEELHNPNLLIEDKIRLSAGRCARVSYLTQEGIRDAEADFKLHDRLANQNHWSPFEHQGQALSKSIRSGNFVGWKQYRKFFGDEQHGRDLEDLPLEGYFKHE